MSSPAAQRWRVLSPLLDELLDLDAAARAARLDQLAADDPALAEELRALLARDEALSEDGFMTRPVADALQLTPAPAITAGMTLGPYRLEQELGQGGMGSVWTAVRADGRFEGRVAVKFLRSGLFAAGDAGRFAREGQILAKLTHPHIARLLDAGVVDSQPYLVLEHVDGQPIDVFCREQGLGLEARVRLFLDVLAAVGHAHARLILHRDLKPSNILVTREGDVKLLDFGIAKLLDDAGHGDASSELTQLAGHAYTPQYAAPEQVQQTEVTTATDVYALGVLLYQLLGGGHPTAADTQMRLDLLKAVVEQVPRRLSDAAAEGSDASMSREARALRGDLDTIVAKALKKAPAERYVNAQAMADDLRRWLAHEPISARPDSRLYVLGRFVRRHRAGVGLAALALSALLALTVTSLLQARRAELAESQAQLRRQQAEDVLSFMLGEFADKLRPVGRLDLLDSIGGKALKVLDGSGALSPANRLQRAKALTVIGEVRVSKRDLEGALEPLAAAGELLQGDPPTPDMTAAWRKAQGAAAFWQGEAFFRQRQLEPAEVHWARYRDVSAKWLEADPKDADAQLELSYAENSLGSLWLRQGQFTQAEGAFRHSLALKEALLAQRPDDAALQSDWGDSVSWLGRLLYLTGRYASAAEAIQRALPPIQALRQKRPAELEWLKRETGLLLNLSDAQLAAGQSASMALTRAKAAADQLQRGDPANVGWAFLALEIDANLVAQGAAGSAADRSAQALALLRKLEGLRPGKPVLDSWLPRSVRLLHLASLSACKPADCEAREQAMARVEQRLATVIAKPPVTLEALNAAVWLQLLKANANGIDGASRQAACSQARSLLQLRNGWLRTHAELTQHWLDVQKCLDPRVEDEPDWLASRDWLLQQRDS